LFLKLLDEFPTTIYTLPPSIIESNPVFVSHHPNFIVPKHSVVIQANTFCLCIVDFFLFVCLFALLQKQVSINRFHYVHPRIPPVFQLHIEKTACRPAGCFR